MSFKYAGAVLAKNGFKFFGSTSSTNNSSSNRDSYFLIYHKKNKDEDVIASALVSMLDHVEHMVEIFSSKIIFGAHDDFNSCAIIPLPVSEDAWIESAEQLKILELYLKNMES